MTPNASALQERLDNILDCYYGPGWRDQPQPVPRMVELCLDCIAAKRLAEVQVEHLHLPVVESVALRALHEREATERGFTPSVRRSPLDACIQGIREVERLRSKGAI